MVVIKIIISLCAALSMNHAFNAAIVEAPIKVLRQTMFYGTKAILSDNSQNIDEDHTVIEENTAVSKPEESWITEIIDLDMTFFNQLSGEIYSSTGCGPTSTAMLLVSEKGLNINKDTAVKDAYENGFYYLAGSYFTSGRGVTQEDIQKLIEYYGYTS